MIIFSNLFARVVSAILLVPTDVIEREMPMMTPLPMWGSRSQYNRRNWVDGLLAKCWNEKDGFEISHHDDWSISENDSTMMSYGFCFKPSTYGEITSTGARQLFYHMGLLTNEELSSSSSVVFMDWGSGTGKLVAQACLELDHITRAIGIEFSKSRHDVACLSKEKLIQAILLDDPRMGTMVDQRLQLQHGDFFNYDTSDATHVYISSLCFPPEMMQRLEQKICNPSSHLECVASLRKFPTLSILPQVHYVEMSWTRPKGVPVYFYFF